MKKMNNINILYINSLGETLPISIPLNGTENLMEIIRDYGYEDWGECRGRTWCRSCHVELNANADFSDDITPEERSALSLIQNKNQNSRLACQITINSALDSETIYYRGED